VEVVGPQMVVGDMGSREKALRHRGWAMRRLGEGGPIRRRDGRRDDREQSGRVLRFDFPWGKRES
jgi:hypothetical protein